MDINPALSKGGKSVAVIPEELLFDEVHVSTLGQVLTSSALSSSKLLLKNNLSAKIKLELKPNSPDKLKVEPTTLILSAFES